VNAEHVRAPLEREDVRGDRAGQPLRRRQRLDLVDLAAARGRCGDAPEERLARGPDHERAPEREELAQPAQQL
jgi:hypothetical protein